MAMGATLVASDAADLVDTGGSARGGQESSLVGKLLLDRYRIIARLGAGGMGVVYLAEHVTLKKRCAIKVLSDEFANKEDIVERFLQEARAASMIAHENVVEITDYGQTPSGSVFFVMEMLSGEDLADTIRSEGPLPWERVRPIMMQICRALSAAHDKGIIHRDMKPENCFRIERGGTTDFIKVLDFGIAKVTNDEGESKGLTKTGMIFGTPEYMSPEQAQGMRVDHRADIYAAGIIMYELLTGKVPFTADTFMGVLTKHMFEVPVAPSSIVPSITPEVESVILKALQKEREHRFATMRDLLAAIESVSNGGAAVSLVNENIVRPPVGRLLAFGGGATAITAPQAEPASRSTSPLWILAIVGVLGIAAIAALMLGPNDAVNASETGTKEPIAAPPTEPKSADGPPAEPPKDEPVAPALVSVRITSNVEAEIIDPRDGSRLGVTNGADGVQIERGEAPRALLLRAAGYDDLPIEVVPTRDVLSSYDLHKPKVGAKTGKGVKTGVKEPTPKEPTPKEPTPKEPTPKEPTPKEPTPKPKDPPAVTPPGLKDPFGKVGG
jgi:serine/threonine protein kinase